MRLFTKKMSSCHGWFYRLYFLTTLLFTSSTIFAQNSIKGKITSSDGQPIIGATVRLKDSQSTITSSDNTGSFTLSVPNNAILLVSYLGYQSKEVNVSGQNNIVIILEPSDLNELEDVVVVGYGTQSKRNVTGAISSVKATDLALSAASNFAQSLQGKTPGIQVTQSTGQPGANVNIQIRTNPSFASAGTLYVIDGVPIGGNAGNPVTAFSKYGTSGVDPSPMNFINPNDIESISILKDAASSSIYGARAGAGVVLITTKKGKAGDKPIVNYSSSYGIQDPARLYSLLGTKEYMKQRNLIIQEMWARDKGIVPYYGTANANSVGTPDLPFTQTQIDTAKILPSALDRVLRNGYAHQQNIAINGSNQNTTYGISGRFFDQKGIVIGSGFKSYNTRISLEQQLSTNVKAGGFVIMSNMKTDNINTGGLYENSGIIQSANYWPAHLPLQAPDGSYPLNPVYSNSPNPLSFETVTDFTKSFRSMTSGYLQWEIIDGLTAKGIVTYDQSQNKRNSYYPVTFRNGATVNGLAGINSLEANNLTTDATLNYKKDLLDSRLKMDILGGFGYQRTNSEGVGAGNEQFVSDLLLYYNLGAGQGQKPTVSSGKGQISWVSGYSRANFMWQNKYTLQVSMRADAASIFAQNKKWGYFPSISGSWIISDESFMQSITSVSDLKLRLSYGQTGNSNIYDGAYPLYGLSASPIFGNNQTATGIAQTQAGNSNLSWETVSELNAGLDFGLFKNRMAASVDVYTKSVRDMLVNIPLPPDNLTENVKGNAGIVRSYGWELGIGSKNVLAKSPRGFTWDTQINLSHYYSYWTERSPEALKTLSPWINATGKNAPFNGTWGYVAEGLYTGTWGEQPAHMPGMLPGGIIIKDVNGFDETGNLTGVPDGKISAADQILLVKNDPKLNFGIGNSFSFKNIDFSVFFSGWIRRGWSPASGMGTSSVQSRLAQFGWNVLENVGDRWSYYNPNNALPTGINDATYGGFQNSSSYYADVNSSFLRCRNITLGYSLPSQILGNKKFISAVRIYADGQNLFTVTSKDYKGFDPELYQDNFYPFAKSYVMGVNITF